MPDPQERARLVEQAHRHLERVGQPRLVMGGVVVVTIAAGFLASVGMLHLGLDRMSLRYPLAVLVAYATFLGMLRVWLRCQPVTPWLGDDPEGLLVPSIAAIGLAALGDKAAILSDEAARPEKQKSQGLWGLDGLGNVGDLGDLGEGYAPLVLLVLIAGLCTLIVSVYLVATSPLLLAELLVDGAVLGALSRPIRLDPAPHWWRSVVRRTWPAALITVLVFGLVGYGIERVASGARTLGAAWAGERGR